LIAPNWEKQLWTVTNRRPSPPDIADVAKLDPRSHHAVAFLETVTHLTTQRGMYLRRGGETGESANPSCSARAEGLGN
jgi:hypothetical protein